MGRNFDDYPGPGQKTPAKVYVLQYIDICSDAVFHARMWVKKIVVKFVFSKKATKFDTYYILSKRQSIFVAFLENTNLNERNLCYLSLNFFLEICSLKLRDWKGFRFQRMCKNYLRLPGYTQPKNSWSPMYSMLRHR